MPEYLHPGVYVDEISSDSHAIQAAGTSTACFIGETVRGRPFAPTLVTSFTEFQRELGGIVRRAGDLAQRDLPLAVKHFFDNGGGRVFVVRTVDPAGSEVAAGEVAGAFAMCAAGVGRWGNDIEVVLQANVVDPKRFDVHVLQHPVDPEREAQSVEQFMGLGLDPDAPKFFAAIINRDSNFIEIRRNAKSKAFFESKELPTKALGLTVPEGSSADRPAQTRVRLTGGADGSEDEALSTAALEQATASIHRFTEISILAAPGITDATRVNQLVAYVEARPLEDLFLILDGSGDQQSSAGEDALEQVQTQLAGITDKSSYAALYWPWIEVADPYSDVVGATRFAPPSGAVAGLFARTDNSRGVWKAPAGMEATVQEAVGLATRVGDAQQDLLNPVGINVIRQFDFAGIVVWGARTLASQSNPEYRYVPVRRMAIFLRESLYRGTQWVVFEPNDEPLWSSIRANLDSFMSAQFRSGAFQGGSFDEAFFVQCDSTNNYQATIDAGQVNIRVGFAPVKPAEFVIIELQQIHQDS